MGELRRTVQEQGEKLKEALLPTGAQFVLLVCKDINNCESTTDHHYISNVDRVQALEIMRSFMAQEM